MSRSRNRSEREEGDTRREFIKKGATASLGAVLGTRSVPAAAGQGRDPAPKVPWYRTTLRWGQTNINEMDPARYDIEWWRQHWKRTRVQGVIINAGGIVAYYPSRFPLHYRAEHLGDRDLFGELTRAAHEDGIMVLARMDSNRTREDFYRAHPDWFAVDSGGKPYRADERYITCIDSPYYEEYLLAVLREIIERYHPEGFTDNSWTGLGRDQICYCRYSSEKFRQATGKKLPPQKDWADPAYRDWIRWSYRRRLEIWDLNNRATKEAGGADCLWLGMIGGDFISQGRSFRDLKGICERAEMIMLDDQGRRATVGFQGNAEIGKRLHGLLGWEKLIPESMAMYQRAPTFRKAAASGPEARLWMLSGFAGMIHPWWHHVGAYQWDRRQFNTAGQVYRWYEANEEYLTNREPVATVGVVYSQENSDFYGRDEAEDRVGQPYNGMIQALVRARIPYIPVHADHVGREASRLSLLILPNLAAMSEEQTAAVRRYVQGGGGLLATGETSICNEWGDRRADFALADLFGARFTGKSHGSAGGGRGRFSGADHSYLRLLPDVGREVYGARDGHEPVVSPARHPVLRGFEETDIVAFGGLLLEVKPEAESHVPMTFIPNFPIYPPETSWMREPRTSIPGLVLAEPPGGGRRAYLPADLDRRFSRDNLPDHGDLLANLIRWTARDNIPLQVEGRGLIDCNLYRQDRRMVLHLVNLTSAGAWRSPVHELIPVGPLRIRVRLAPGVAGKSVRMLVSGRTQPAAVEGEWLGFEAQSLLDHEVVVID